MDPLNLAKIITDRAATTMKQYDYASSSLVCSIMGTIVYLAASEALALLGMLFHGSAVITRSFQVTAQLLRLSTFQEPGIKLTTHLAQFAYSARLSVLTVVNIFTAQNYTQSLQNQKNHIFGSAPETRWSKVTGFVNDHQTAISYTLYGLAALVAGIGAFTAARSLYGTISKAQVSEEETQRLKEVWEAAKTLCENELGKFYGEPGESANCLLNDCGISRSPHYCKKLPASSPNDVPPNLLGTELANFAQELLSRNKAQTRSVCLHVSDQRALFQWPKSSRTFNYVKVSISNNLDWCNDAYNSDQIQSIRSVWELFEWLFSAHFAITEAEKHLNKDA